LVKFRHIPYFFLGHLLFLLCCLTSCQTNKNVWDHLKENGSENYKEIITNAEKYELQILYTTVKNDSNGKPTIFEERFNVDTSQYFYPASTVKMPVAFLALQRLGELREEGIKINMHSPLKIHKSRDAQSEALADSTSSTGLASIAHYINKLFAVSDNDAYNRLYEFLGRDYINNTLQEKGVFSNSRIVTRVGVGEFDYHENAHTNAMDFYSADTISYHKEAMLAKGNFLNKLDGDIKGKGYFIDGQKDVINAPFDMRTKNFVNLIDLQESLQRIIIPEYYSPEERFDIGASDYNFLKTALSKLPKEYSFPDYDAEYYYDSYGKFFMYGDSKAAMPDHIKIYNKVGYAYGTLTDCAYIEDVKNDIRFFITATLLVNENEIFNDNTYEYDKGISFLAELGRMIYTKELESK